MKKVVALLLIYIPILVIAQENKYSDFEEYNLKNGLHVILHQDINEPNVIVGVKYHVGSKNEEAGKTGFAHFFEHLLFHGTKNIPQGEFEKVIMNAGGYINAYTTYDVTYYYQLLPAHEYKLGLWAESERMLHPVITKEGIARECEIVKEEKRMRYDNKPLGNAYFDMMEQLYPFDSYGHPTVGSMNDLNTASLADFQLFFKKWYVPNNACLVVSGNIDIEETKKWIEIYFKDIPKGKIDLKSEQVTVKKPINRRVDIDVEGLKKTAISVSYPLMSQSDSDALVMHVITSMLTRNGSNSYFSNLDNDTIISQVKAATDLWEDVGAIRITGKIKNADNDDYYVNQIENKLDSLKNNLIDELLLKKTINELESYYVDKHFHAETFADEITKYHHLYGGADKMNDVIGQYVKITPEDVQRVAQKYFKSENKVVIVYHPNK